MTFTHDYDLDALEPIQVHGQRFCMQVTPRFRDRYENTEYEAYTARLLARMCARAAVFIDVGAHYGFFSLLVASRYPKLRVIAVEPSRVNFDVLERNIAANGFAKVERLNVAISNRDGEADLLISEASDNCSFYCHPSAGRRGTEQVRTTTIDGLLATAKSRPTVIKIDTDGHEFEVLDGMRRTIERNPDIALFVEFNPKMIEVAGRKPADLICRLDALGFAIFLLDDVRQQHFRVSPETDWTTLFDPRSYANLVCLPKACAVSVLFFSHSVALGGAERSLLELVDEWMSDHWVLATIVCPHDGQLTTAMRS
ncbi:MAG TPA: FkbM family methyltransferase, partial [Pyrinomonadaceae bacterium]|nr:FkbM family methyltransferase [Pyrinomonadaceae bacterium]